MLELESDEAPRNFRERTAEVREDARFRWKDAWECSKEYWVLPGAFSTRPGGFSGVLQGVLAFAGTMFGFSGRLLGMGGRVLGCVTKGALFWRRRAQVGPDDIRERYNQITGQPEEDS